MTTPARITLSRAKGFNLQAASLALNGLPAVKVDRTTKFGNPFTVKDAREAGLTGTDNVLAARCVFAFRIWIDPNYSQDIWHVPESEKAKSAILDNLASLRGKNLACWCKQGQPCHADVLIHLANRPACEEVK